MIEFYTEQSKGTEEGVVSSTLGGWKYRTFCEIILGLGLKN